MLDKPITIAEMQISWHTANKHGLVEWLIVNAQAQRNPANKKI